MGEVVKLGGSTKQRVEPDKILDSHAGSLSDVVLLGIDKNTGRFVAACSNADLERAVFLAQRFIHKAVRGDYGSPLDGMELSNG